MARPESIRRAHIALAVLAVTILVASVVPVPSATPQTDPTGSVDTTTLCISLATRHSLRAA